MTSTSTDNREPGERSSLFTILLWVCIVVVLGGVFTAVAYIMTNTHGYSLADAAASQVRSPLTNACNTYQLKNGDWPDSLQTLLVKTERGGPYLENAESLRDPWGGYYQYDFRGPENDGARPDIWAINPTTGAKIGNWPSIPMKQ